MFVLLLLVHALALVSAQLPFPAPPFLPPDASAGASRSASGSPNTKWSSLLGNLLYFYEAQRSGVLRETNRVLWRNSSCVEDGQLYGVDLSGGYYDAGDYIKSTFTLSFTLMSICWGATDFGKGYDLANQTAYLDDMLRWGLDWLIKAHTGNNTLYVLVGASEIDNSYWGGDLTIPNPRPVYQINATNPGTDAAAGASAAFAACSCLYSGNGFGNTSYSSPAQLTNTSYADTLLTHAHALYTFAVNATGGRKTYQTSVPEVATSYASSGYGDEMAIAALFLAHATGNGQFIADADEYWARYGLDKQTGVFNWDSKTPGLPVLFAQITHNSPDLGANFTKWQTVAEKFFDAIVNGTGSRTTSTNGLLWYDGDSDEASLNPALNAAMLLARYAPLASSPGRQTAYENFAKAQLDYALGKNPMSVPYIVGVNPNSPSNPHSAMASGGMDITHIDTSPEVTAHVLYGAVVGGPDKRDRFFDIRSDWPQTEIALDYNAPMLTLAAMHVLSDSDDPFYTSIEAGAYDKVKPQGLPCDAAFRSSGCSGPQLSKGGKIAMAIAVTLTGLLIAGLLAWYLVLLCRRGRFPQLEMKEFPAVFS